MKILGNRILVSKVDEPVQEGFQTVEVQDSFLYKGKVEQLGTNVDSFKEGTIIDLNDSMPRPAYPIVSEGNIILFKKYSPDTEEVDIDGQKMKIIRIEDVLAIYE